MELNNERPDGLQDNGMWRYQKVRQLGHVKLLGKNEEDLLSGLCYIFPKIDGSNCQVWIDDSKIQTASRNIKILDGNEVLNGFRKYILNDSRFIRFAKAEPKLRLYGEWTGEEHAILDYANESKNKFYIFDVRVAQTGEYLSIEAVKSLCERFQFDYIPAI